MGSRRTDGLADGGGGRLRAHGGGHVDAVLPVVALEDQGEVPAHPPAEQEGADGHARRVLPLRIDGGTLGGGGGETGIGVGRGATAARGPVVALPVDQMLGRLLGQALPPDVAVVGEGAVGEDAVGVQVARALGLDSAFVPGATPKKPDSGLMA